MLSTWDTVDMTKFKLPWQKDKDAYVLRVDLSTKEAIDRLKNIVENANYLIDDLERVKISDRRPTEV